MLSFLLQFFLVAGSGGEGSKFTHTYLFFTVRFGKKNATNILQEIMNNPLFKKLTIFTMSAK